MAKQVRMEEGADRISNLPEEILSHILSFLSTKEAIRMSILSSRWRYLFASLSNLDFELDPKKRRSSTIKSFVSFVNRVLFLHNTSVEKFRLKCGKAVDSSHVKSWISAALWRGARHLDLCIYNDKHNTLPGVLFTCSTLVTLQLDIKNFVFNVPSDGCLPNLKTLHLKSIKFFNDDSVKKLFSSCVSLEDMLIEECNLKNLSVFCISHPLLKRLTIIGSNLRGLDSSYWTVINAPNLGFFKYTDKVAVGNLLINMQSLLCNDFDYFLDDYGFIFYNRRPVDAIAFLSQIRSLRLRDLPSTFVEHVLSREPLPDFQNMVQLEIFLYSWAIWYYYLWENEVQTLLRSSPFQDFLMSLPGKVPICLMSKLKEVEILEFKARQDCIEKAIQGS